MLEHDDIRFSAADVLWIHEHTGVRLVFDYQHFWCLNPERLEMVDTIRRILATWPTSIRPKLHYSSPRTELRAIKRGGSVCLNSGLRWDKWSPAGFRLPRIATAG